MRSAPEEQAAFAGYYDVFVSHAGAASAANHLATSHHLTPGQCDRHYMCDRRKQALCGVYQPRAWRRARQEASAAHVILRSYRTEAGGSSGRGARKIKPASKPLYTCDMAIFEQHFSSNGRRELHVCAISVRLL